MNFEPIKSIQFSLLEKKSEIRENNNASYSKKITSKFTFPDNFVKNEESLEELCEQMYQDLLANVKDDFDSLGLWIEYGVEYDNIIVDSAISIKTLDDIKEYSKIDINPIYEFFKMNVKE